MIWVYHYFRKHPIEVLFPKIYLFPLLSIRHFPRQNGWYFWPMPSASDLTSNSSGNSMSTILELGELSYHLLLTSWESYCLTFNLKISPRQNAGRENQTRFWTPDADWGLWCLSCLPREPLCKNYLAMPIWRQGFQNLCLDQHRVSPGWTILGWIGFEVWTTCSVRHHGWRSSVLIVP